MKPEIDKEVQKTMSSLDGLQPADPGPYFYSRLTSKMSNYETEDQLGWIGKLAFSILILLNVSLFFWDSTSQEQATTDPLETLSESYFGTTDAAFDLALNEMNNEE